MTTLTPQILGMYIGQQVKTTAGNDYILVGFTWGFETTNCYLRNATGLIGNCHIDDVKLILRPLSSMTEEEWMNEMPCSPALNPTAAIVPVFNPEQFKWLLSKGFDLFGLIPAGLAINSTIA